jgi:non-ribosomal peptide synthetase-like protein
VGVVSGQIEAEQIEDSFGPQAGEDSAGQVLICSTYEQSVRWQAEERLQQLFEDRCDRIRDKDRSDHLAVDGGGGVLTYNQLDARANQLARHLLARGARPGDRIALLFDQAVHSYVGMLAVLKIHAAYVPLDVGFPPDRLSYILQDSGARIVLSLLHLHDRLEDVPATLFCLDEVEALLATEDDRRLTHAERGDPVDELAYIIYTSGSTGRPKGVAIEHASICNFVRVAVEIYGIEPRDRVYQGMTIAFDFAVEEIWVPLIAGATLVPKPGGFSLLGQELGEYLQANRVTALCCVPTLLATLDEDLPCLRFLLVSGEACPQDLIARWHRPGRRFLNVYGPTEATVTATWTPVHPDRPVTIGVPLPTYSVVILHPDKEKALLPGEMGEIGIAGIGLARGYVNRDDLTDRAFVTDFIGIEGNPSGRIYRTGDLGRVNDDGEIEYHGRIDTQVKVRGYRIELTEIESALLQMSGIAQAVVDTYEPEPGLVELVAYYTPRNDIGSVDPGNVYEHLLGRLPGYMVPAYLVELAVMPMLPSDKVDRKNLPVPGNRRNLATQRAYARPTSETEEVLADALARVLRVARLSVDDHFFNDLGANSLLMANFCARVRERADLPPVAMKDVYLHPTITSLATALENASPAAESPTPVAAAAVPPARTPQYVLCGALQLLVFLGYTYLTGVIVVAGAKWISAGTGWTDTYLRSLVFCVATFIGLSVAPILAKWLLIGRWRPQEIPVWSLAYVRFWTVKVLIRSNPLVLFVGSPLYMLYLRALGAKIGRNVAIFSQVVPVCTDLLTIGDGTVIRKDSSFTCYRAHAGVIQTGAVTLGKDVLVGEATVLDVDTSMGDAAQLGHSSSLHVSQRVPDGQSWHGSPAEPADVNYRAVDPTGCGPLRRVAFSVMQVLNRLVLVGPIVVAVFSSLSFDFLSSGPLTHSAWGFYRDRLALSFILFFGGVLTALALVVTVPRVLNRALVPGRIYPLYGLRYWVQRMISRMTNLRFFMELTGDSSLIVHYLRLLGYDMPRVEQTGSNFGVALKHETPYLSSIGTGTMVSDGLSIINADFSNTSFRVSRASVGSSNFFGNNIAYPSGSRTGDNCLLATKVMVPVSGDVREGVGLLGSPCFEIPRSVQRDGTFDALKSGDERRRRLADKNAHNAVTILLFLLTRWIYLFVALLLGSVALELYKPLGSLAVVAFGVLMLLFTVGYFVLIERASLAFRALRPLFCSIYEPAFWRHERFWKLSATSYLEMFNGTPFKNVIWRLLGVRAGRRVFDDGCAIPEKTLVTIGDDCTLNALSLIQCHSMEDGAFKVDGITIGAGCTVGVNALIHYAATMGDRAALAPDSFLMKGEEVPPQAHFGGNPARELPPSQPAATLSGAALTPPTD